MGKKVYEYGIKFNDILTEDEIEKWEGENVILNGATGSGKTTWVLNTLNKYVNRRFKKILFLCNRTALYRDILIQKDECGLYSMDIMLYQTLESKIKKKELLERYDYIVCDEFHYVLTDAMFNIYTDLTYDWIVNRNNSIKIFMSGTGRAIFNKLKNDNIVKEEFEYIIPYNYSYADVKLFSEKNKVYDIINNIINNTDDKIIYFSNSMDFAIEIYSQFKEHSVFRCSESTLNEEAKKINDVDCIRTYNRKLITFNNRLLITTKALDNGINIVDKNVKHIICDVFDLESAQQCLGRKRVLDKDDKCTFYIRNYGKKALGNFKGGIKKDYNPVKMFIEDIGGFNETYNKNRKFHSNFIYFDGDKRRYNKLAYWKMLVELIDIEQEEKQGYANVFLSRLGDTFSNIENLDNIEQYNIKSELELYLRGNLYKKYYKEDKKELIDKIGLKDSRNRIQKSINTLNPYLQENFNLYIFSDEDKRRKLDDGSVNINRKKIFWELREGKIY
ncbi:DEAD/DEAH box helicase family protein [Clostridium tertium]|uniref:DEAD/DEAH box helicase family protein n=1 Tax=Clostridium tertium TaxID=1559 RepID=UPI00232DD7EB|nr:DEAD/DEAH box helicase family protein [Clostridium tertium]MDB1931695.1 DEAD/DEAH box helicase family protein [Clostridium tertium]MDB1938259.1 DEAD/DEAH box helicase family protein [Clostridium tertium]MDI9216064.1 DEAD/DEAH box helicase family protein [Clostridium tertium]